MPTARKTKTPCPRCGCDDDVWVQEKAEPTVTKVQYTCESCGCEWMEVRKD
jgi:transposase-like protein